MLVWVKGRLFAFQAESTGSIPVTNIKLEQIAFNWTEWFKIVEKTSNRMDQRAFWRTVGIFVSSRGEQTTVNR